MSRSNLVRAREQSGLSAADVARRTRLSPRIVAAIEEERFELLPAGLYARTAVRTYAQAVGWDPDAALAAVHGRLPQAPLDLAELAELRTSPRRVRREHYAAAAALDAALLLLIDAAVVCICATTCGLPPSILLAAAPGSMAILCSTPIVLYFWLLGATDVRTAGPWLLGVQILPRPEGPLSFEDWWRRGFLYVAREVKLAGGLTTPLAATIGEGARHSA
jgi:transcriptional regulator with XRE-family HTH domain